MKKHLARVGAALAAIAVVALSVAAVTATASAKATVLTIWSDKSRLAAVTKVANDWAASRGATVKVVEKDFGQIRDSLTTVDAATAPDVVVGAHDWTGQLAANGLVLPIYPNRATRNQFPDYTLAAFSYGTAVKKLYGAPTQVENIALIVNTKLAQVPTSWADLEAQALKFKKGGAGRLGIAVQQGTNGDAYHMYPFFSGLGGYVFGTNKAGNLDPSDIGVASPELLKNAALIDKWNKEGLINSKVDSGVAQNAFLKGQATFWITGPWNVSGIKAAGIKYKIVQVPPIVKPAVPFLGVQGFMVTKFATTHGVESAARDLVSSYMMTPAAQLALATANGRPPANAVAAKKVTDPDLAAFSVASKGGVPMPNIPQMSAVWSELGTAWVKATQGSTATPAATAFKVAARNIANKIG